MPTSSTTSAAWRRAEARLRAWFATLERKPAAFQRAAWRAWADGQSGLIHAPTGTGKTLAAVGGPLIDAVLHPARGMQLLWITPLRSLATDTAHHLTSAVEAMELPWRVLRRTGDSSSERAKLRRGDCELLVTTPESLALLLSYPDAADRFKHLRGVVVDEWHELIGNKRGTLLQLGLSRLRTLQPAIRVWGLSATLGNLDEALATLAGEGVLIGGGLNKKVHIQTALPDEGERFPWAGHLGLKQLARVLKAVLEVRSALVFANTRSQAELWHEALASVWPEAPETLAIHHGSIDPKLRFATEEGLRQGTLRCVVATSSLDLGVDFSNVDRVIQIGSPKSVARLLQRAGRSGHAPGLPSKILCVPTHLLELAEIAATHRALASHHLEPRHPLRGCLDVLAQHLLTRALGGGFEADQALRKSSPPARMRNCHGRSTTRCSATCNTAAPHWPAIPSITSCNATKQAVTTSKAAAWRGCIASPSAPSLPTAACRSDTSKVAGSARSKRVSWHACARAIGSCLQAATSNWCESRI